MAGGNEVTYDWKRDLCDIDRLASEYIKRRIDPLYTKHDERDRLTAYITDLEAVAEAAKERMKPDNRTFRDIAAEEQRLIAALDRLEAHHHE
jgi:hypothetical protein